MKIEMEFQVATTKEGRFIKDTDILSWLRWHAENQPELAEIFNMLVDEIIGIK